MIIAFLDNFVAHCYFSQKAPTYAVLGHRLSLSEGPRSRQEIEKNLRQNVGFVSRATSKSSTGESIPPADPSGPLCSLFPNVTNR